MIHARDHEAILWDGFVYQRVGTPEEVGISAGRPMAEGEPSGVVATERITHGSQIFEKGDELPGGVGFPHGAQRVDISVAILRGLNFERLIAKGVAKRKRLPGRRRRA